MSDPLRDAKELVSADLERFEATLMESLQSQGEYLTRAEYETYRRGKRLRPVLLLLSAHSVQPAGTVELPDKVIKASVSLEMLHVATLIHDDIVDVAPLRRGIPTVYSERGPEMAVLIGDMQFIQAIRCFVDGIDTQRDMDLVKMVLNVGFDLCRGELDEIMTDPSIGIDKLIHRYLRTVDRKTATLFAMACESGALLIGASEGKAFRLGRYGRRLGTGFQIMDDIFDLMRSDEVAGKTKGTDIEQGRLSLPILYALDGMAEHTPLRRILGGEPHTPEELEQAIASVTDSPALLRAYSKARELVLEGVDFLAELPESAYRTALENIALYVVNRSYNQPD
jgi:heptaprenyl diphosphate synthase